MSGGRKNGIVKAKIKGTPCKHGWFHNSVSITFGNRYLFHIFQIPFSRKLLDEFSCFLCHAESSCFNLKKKNELCDLKRTIRYTL